jgi:hypothetical protein
MMCTYVVFHPPLGRLWVGRHPFAHHGLSEATLLTHHERAQSPAHGSTPGLLSSSFFWSFSHQITVTLSRSLCHSHSKLVSALLPVAPCPLCRSSIVLFCFCCVCVCVCVCVKTPPTSCVSHTSFLTHAHTHSVARARALSQPCRIWCRGSTSVSSCRWATAKPAW